MSQPVFRTARLLLRPRTEADTDACLAMDREPGVTDHVDVPWHDPAAHRTFTSARTRGPWPPGMGYWTVLEDDAFRGWVLLIPEDGEGPEIEIGWRLRPSTWGRGLATEAAAPVLRHAFLALGLPRVVAGISPANARSLRVAAKLGLRAPTADGPGRYRRCAITREEFAAREGRPHAPAH